MYSLHKEMYFENKIFVFIAQRNPFKCDIFIHYREYKKKENKRIQLYNK